MIGGTEREREIIREELRKLSSSELVRFTASILDFVAGQQRAVRAGQAAAAADLDRLEKAMGNQLAKIADHTKGRLV